MGILKGWIFDRLPSYFKDNDNGKDSNGQGFFERYTHNFDDELDENLKPYIDDILSILSPLTANPIYYPYIARYLGDSLLTAHNDIDKKLLQFAILLIKMRGSLPSYRMIFNLFGFSIIIEEPIVDATSQYDSPTTIYDSTTEYDVPCNPCYPAIIHVFSGGDDGNYLIDSDGEYIMDTDGKYLLLVDGLVPATLTTEITQLIQLLLYTINIIDTPVTFQAG